MAGLRRTNRPSSRANAKGCPRILPRANKTNRRRRRVRFAGFFFGENEIDQSANSKGLGLDENKDLPIYSDCSGHYLGVQSKRRESKDSSKITKGDINRPLKRKKTLWKIQESGEKDTNRRARAATGGCSSIFRTPLNHPASSSIGLKNGHGTDAWEMKSTSSIQP